MRSSQTGCASRHRLVRLPFAEKLKLDGGTLCLGALRKMLETMARRVERSVRQEDWDPRPREGTRGHGLGGARQEDVCVDSEQPTCRFLVPVRTGIFLDVRSSLEVKYLSIRCVLSECRGLRVVGAE